MTAGASLEVTSPATSITPVTLAAGAVSVGSPQVQVSGAECDVSLTVEVTTMLLQALSTSAEVAVGLPSQPSVLEVGLIGPQGPAGTGEEDMPYAKRVDFVGDTLLYRGEAAPGAAETAPAWRIQRLTFVGDDVTYEWAAGTAAFDKVWANRATLSYL
jgi:hypothetical protein